MPQHPVQRADPFSNTRRRNALRTLAATACLLGSASGRALAQMLAAEPTQPASPLPAPQAELWRAVSRLGYGPSEDLLHRVVAAGGARAWAAQQVDTALAASHLPPRMDAALADFNAPLPQIFAGARAEREARARLKEAAASEAAPANPAAADFLSNQAPEHFSRTMAQQSAAWHLASCSQPEQENPLLARMTEFWFNHLNVYVGKGAVRPFVGHYVVNVARAHALGKLEDLLLASARHPAMLLYLDQARSVAEGSRGPQGSTRGLNENYARELMELHTLGVDGGYTQNDVRELARVLTGWTVSPNDSTGFQFVARLHDNAAKHVMGQPFPSGANRTGEREGEDAIRMLARHPRTARRISLRLAQFFVADQPAAPLVNQLSQVFLGTQGDMAAVMRALLQSPDFWDPANRLFKTPLDFVCSALAATQTTSDRRSLVLAQGFLNNAGQPLHGWQTPDGYKTDAATWLVPEALTRRADFALALARQSPEIAFLSPFLSASTRQSIAQEPPALRAGLALASPDFMVK